MKILEMILLVCFVLFIALFITGIVLMSVTMLIASFIAAGIGMMSINELDSLARLERHSTNSTNQEG